MKIKTNRDVWMGRLFNSLSASICLIGSSAIVFAEAVHPAKLSSSDLTGKAFENPNTIVTETPTGNIFDITSLKSSDGKFASGMYKAGKSRFEITEPGVWRRRVHVFPGRQRHPDVKTMVAR